MFRNPQIFLTFACSGKCSYCIQGNIDRKSYPEVHYSKWIKLFTDNQFGDRLGLIGGEPTICKGFKEIVEALHTKYLITVTTNLKSKLFEDMGGFINWAADKRVRWNLSFHPSVLSVDKFIELTKTMRVNGLWIDQVASVTTEEIKPDVNQLLSSNIGFWLQTNTYLGDDGVLHPTKKELTINGAGETGITNSKRYNFLCGGKKDISVMCVTNKFLISPNGDVYRCHRDLYANECSIGNVFDIKNIKPNMMCYSVGECNMCDYGSIRYWRI